MPKKYSNLDRTVKAEKSMAAAEARGKKSRVASKADPYKPGKDSASKAKARQRQDARTPGVRVTGRFGVKETGPTPTNIRAGEWNQRSAEMRANKRAKARKNPTGKAATELKAKGYDAAKVNKVYKERKEASAQQKRVTSAIPSGGPALSRVTSNVTKKAKAPAAKRGKRY